MGTRSHAAGDSPAGGLIGHEDEQQTPVPAQPVSSSSSSSSQSFEFVLVNDQGSRRQVRRHAMRQYMRQRRLDGIARLASSRAPMPGWLTATDPPCESVIQEDAEHVDENSKSHARAIIPLRTRNYENQYRHDLPNSRDSSPVSLISPGVGGMRDPFNSYPMPISEQDHRLINHYVVTYPAMMYRLSNPLQKNPMMEIFREFALKDRLPFQAMLAIASKHLASVEGQSDSLQSLGHKTQTLQLINRTIRDTSDEQLDNFIYAVATMAVIEKWSKDPSIERMHIKGLTLLIRRRGGMRALKAEKPFLEQIIYWVDFSCAAKAIVGASLPWTGQIPDAYPEQLRSWSPGMQPDIHSTEWEESDYIRACEDFLGFFRTLYAAQQAMLKAPYRAPSITGRRPGHIFNSSSRLYCILTTLPDYDHGIRDIRFIDEYTCLACLLYLNIALYDYYNKQQNFDSYLIWLESETQQLSAEPSVSSFMWIFLDNGGYAQGETGDAGERNWLVSRMLRVAKRLEWSRQGALWEYLRSVLIDFVCAQQECGLGAEDIGEEEIIARQKRLEQGEPRLWDENGMRREILGNLYRELDGKMDA